MFDDHISAERVSAEAETSGLAQGIALLVLLGAAIQVVTKSFKEIGRKAEDRHLRAIRAKAWRVRRAWRKADIPRLAAYGFSGADYDRYHRAAEERKKGRGVVAPFVLLPETVERGLTILRELGTDNPPLPRRRTLLRKTAIEPLIVEGLYRGAHEENLSAGITGAADKAKATVADIMGMSSESVHKHCVSVRRGRRTTGIKTLTLPEITPGFFRALILPSEDELDNKPASSNIRPE